ncbi:MAG: heterodisulfide reductase-related iron-sulfur binding cluster [bacterium]
MANRLPIFWGCTIAHRLPFIENATRRALQTLGIEIVDVEGFSCCPDPLFSRLLGEETTLALSARNLALAAAAGPELLVECNGCYQSLATAARELGHRDRREAVNARLAAAACRYEGGVRPLHILEALRRLGADAVKECVARPLTGLRLAVHYGCHALAPPPLAVDDAADPGIIEDTVRALGAEPVAYGERLSCCGGSLSAFDEGASAQLLRRKMRSVDEAGADAVVLTCPSCFLQFDLRAKLVDEDLRLPVFHLAELMCLAFGVPAGDLRFKGWHAVRVDDAMKIIGAEEEGEDLRRHFDVESLAECCGSCTYECTVVRGQADVAKRNVYDPMAVVDKVVAGEVEPLLADEEIWYCIACHECALRCPHGRGLAGTFETLRRLALARGVRPEAVTARLDSVRKTGLGLAKQDWAREEFGLGPASQPSAEEVAKVLGGSDDE